MNIGLGRVQWGLASVVVLALYSPTVVAQQGMPGMAAPAAAAPHAGDAPPPPLPAAAHVDQSIDVGGKPLKYTVTVEALPVYGAGDKKIGEVVVTAYTAGQGDRPVTFAMNGGPGAASVFLNFGAIGPKHVAFGQEGDSPSAAATLTDNPGTWLDFTDLVFIDPIGTGFSRSLEDASSTKRDFYSTENDIHYLSRIISDWLMTHERLRSRKYLVGESYGGYRVPRIAHYLQTQLGIAVSGVVAVSPALNTTIGNDADFSPMSWIVNLPSMAAANLERQHKLSAETMAPVIAYARGEYATDLLKGRSDPQALARIVDHVTQLTGLDRQFLQRSGGRIDVFTFLRESHRDQGRVGSVYDSNVTSFDPFPYSPFQRSNDPLLETTIAPTTTAMVDFVTRVVGWHATGVYNTLSTEVNMAWDRNSPAFTAGAVADLRGAVATDPDLRVLIVHGWNDLACPFMASVLTVDQMPIMGNPGRVSVREYPGGHMFYARPASLAALHKDVQAMFEDR